MNVCLHRELSKIKRGGKIDTIYQGNNSFKEHGLQRTLCECKGGMNEQGYYIFTPRPVMQKKKKKRTQLSQPTQPQVLSPSSTLVLPMSRVSPTPQCVICLQQSPVDGKAPSVLGVVLGAPCNLLTPQPPTPPTQLPPVTESNPKGIIGQGALKENLFLVYFVVRRTPPYNGVSDCHFTSLFSTCSSLFVLSSVSIPDPLFRSDCIY